MEKKIIFFYWIFCCAVVQSQSNSYRTYNVHDGLAQMKPLCLFMDSNSFLWIGTRSGLSRYDGKTFMNFRNDDGLPHSVITNIVEDNHGNIWMATRGGIAKYDGAKLTGYKFNSGYGNSLEFDKDGNLWIVNTRDDSLFIFKDEKLINITHQLEGLDGKDLANLEYIKSQNRWLASFSKLNGIFELKDSKLYLIEGTEEIITFRRLTNDNMPLFYFRQKEKNFIGYFVDNRPQEIFETRLNFFAVRDSLVYSIKKRKDATVGKYNLRTGKYTNFSNVKLPSPNPLSMDNNQVLWVGTDNGLYQIFDSTFMNYDAVDFPLTWSIVDNEDGKKWLASYPDGLYEWEDNKLKKVITPNIGFHMGAIRTQNNDLIFPTDRGLYMYKDNEYSWLDTCQGCTFIKVFEDVKRNQIITGAANSVRIYKDYQLDRIINEEQGLHPKGYFIALGMDKNGKLWFGSDSGLSIYDYESNKVTKTYTSAKGNLPVNGAITVFKDQFGEMWLGTESGLLLYNYGSDTFKRVFDQEINTQVNSIIEIEDHRLLVAALDGLYIFDNRAFHQDSVTRLSKYNHRNGFIGIEPIHNSLYKDEEGIVLIPCQSHLVRFDPKELKLSKNPLHLRIYDINGKGVSFLEEKDSFHVEKQQDNIKVRFEASMLSDPFDVMYSHKLQNHDNGWSDWQKEGLAEYNNLPHGQYEFMVKARTGFYENNIVQSSKTIVIHLNWWQRYSYLVLWLAALPTVFTIYFFIKNRKYTKAIKKNKELSLLYRLRTLESRMNPHFIFNALTSIQRQVMFTDKSNVENFVVRFSDMLRNYFDLKRDRPDNLMDAIDRVALKEEIEFIDNFIKFQKQLSQNFGYSIEIDEDVNEYDEMIPAMFIQPFVENAIKHGFGQAENIDSHSLRVIFKGKGGVTCKIIDDGVGIKGMNGNTVPFSEFPNASKNSQIIQKRIRSLAMLGYTVDISINSKMDKGTTVKIKFKDNENIQSRHS